MEDVSVTVNSSCAASELGKLHSVCVMVENRAREEEKGQGKRETGRVDVYQKK